MYELQPGHVATHSGTTNCRTRKRAASVRLGLQIDGEDRFFRLLLLPPPRLTEPTESLANKLLEAMPQVCAL